MIEWDQVFIGLFGLWLQRDFTRKLEVKQGSSCTTNQVTRFALGSVIASCPSLTTTTQACACTQWWLPSSRLKSLCVDCAHQLLRNYIHSRNVLLSDDFYPSRCMIHSVIHLMTITQTPYLRRANHVPSPFTFNMHAIRKILNIQLRINHGIVEAFYKLNI